MKRYVLDETGWIIIAQSRLVRDGEREHARIFRPQDEIRGPCCNHRINIALFNFKSGAGVTLRRHVINSAGKKKDGETERGKKMGESLASRSFSLFNFVKSIQISGVHSKRYNLIFSGMLLYVWPPEDSFRIKRKILQTRYYSSSLHWKRKVFEE